MVGCIRLMTKKSRLEWAKNVRDHAERAYDVTYSKFLKKEVDREELACAISVFNKCEERYLLETYIEKDWEENRLRKVEL